MSMSVARGCTVKSEALQILWGMSFNTDNIYWMEVQCICLELWVKSDTELLTKKHTMDLYSINKPCYAFEHVRVACEYNKNTGLKKKSETSSCMSDTPL